MAFESRKVLSTYSLLFIIPFAMSEGAMWAVGEQGVRERRVLLSCGCLSPLQKSSSTAARQARTLPQPPDHVIILHLTFLFFLFSSLICYFWPDSFMKEKREIESETHTRTDTDSIHSLSARKGSDSDTQDLLIETSCCLQQLLLPPKGGPQSAEVRGRGRGGSGLENWSSSTLAFLA